MSEAQVIKETSIPKTRESIKKDLVKMGIQKGDTLLVHSSLSSIGWVVGGEIAVIQALIDVLGEDGTLVMPTHSSGNSDPAKWSNPPVPKEWISTIYQHMPAFNRDITPTRAMGKIAEAFRCFPNAIRSNHPNTSFTALGNNSQYIIEDHPLTPQMGMDSPLGNLYQLETKILLLGVGYGNCTSFHLAETLSNKVSMVKVGASIYKNNQNVWIEYEDFDYDDSDFDKLGADYEKTTAVTHAKVGNAKCLFFPMKPAVDYAVEWIKNNRGNQ